MSVTQGHVSATDHAAPPPVQPIAVAGVLALVLALRVVHFSGALLSPLSYQPGPDEDYYLRFGIAVATGSGSGSPEFTFMDPAYGYLLGALFKVLGTNVPAIYVLQMLLDTATAYAIFVAGRLLGRSRAGLIGALLYGATSTAILFFATLLKETCVAAYLAWGVVVALAVLRNDRPRAWLLLGLYAGCGVALRSNLLLLAITVVALPLLRVRVRVRGPGRGARAAAVAAGIVIALLPWSLRNAHATGSLSPLPPNSGIVLQQLYNDQNPTSAIWIPAFVNYSSPSEIRRGYAAEAERRAGRVLSPAEVDTYWRGQALEFIGAHPGTVAAEIFVKAGTFLSASEIPNNRATAEEKLFSPVLRVLPPPAPLLLALGLVGLIWFAREDPRWPVLAAPIVLAWFSMAVFWAEDRFRFHAYGVLALCAGIGVDQFLIHWKQGRKWPVAGYAGGACALAAMSLYLGVRMPAPAIRWDHVVWGYIKMHNVDAARSLGKHVAAEQPDNAPVIEALGYLDSVQENYAEAAQEYQRALLLRPRSYVAHLNLARVYRALGKHQEALAEAKAAVELNPAPDYRALLQQIEAEN